MCLSKDHLHDFALKYNQFQFQFTHAKKLIKNTEKSNELLKPFFKKTDQILLISTCIVSSRIIQKCCIAMPNGDFHACQTTLF